MKGFRALDGGGVVIEGRTATSFARLLVQRSALQLEAKGLRLSRGRSVLAMLKAEHGWRGTRASVLAQLEAHIAAERERIEADEAEAEFRARCAAGDPTSIAQAEN